MLIVKYLIGGREIGGVSSDQVPAIGEVVRASGRDFIIEGEIRRQRESFAPYGYQTNVVYLNVTPKPIEPAPAPEVKPTPLTTWTEISIRDWRRSGKGLCGHCRKPHGLDPDAKWAIAIGSSPLCSTCGAELAGELVAAVDVANQKVAS
jgi:hypothetical protein